MRLRLGLSDLLVGLPAGLLMVISTALFTTLLERSLLPPAFPGGEWLGLFTLVLDALVVGLLTGWLRKGRALGSALAAGTVAAVLLLLPWLEGGRGSGTQPLIFGLLGIATAPLLCLLGAWLVAHPRRLGKP